MMNPNLATPSETIAQPIGQPLFFNLPQRDLYWQALVLIGNKNKEAAQQLADAILSNDPVISVFPAWKMDPPPTLVDLFDKLFISAVCRDPQGLSFLGLFESIGLKTHNAYLTDLSIAASTADLDEAQVNLQILEAYSKGEQSKEQNVSQKTALWNLRHIVAGRPFLLHSYPITQMFGALQDLTALFTVFHRLDTQEDCENYLLRLNKIPSQFDQIKERMKTQKEHGIVPPRFSLEKQIQAIEDFCKTPENLFYQTLQKHCSDAKTLGRAKTAIQEIVIPAYRSLQKDLKCMLATATASHGVWALPQGDAYYAYMLKRHTTTKLTADQIHTLGLQETDRIECEIRSLLAQEEMNDPEKEIGDLLRVITDDPKFYYPNTDEGKASCLADYEAILKRSREELGKFFDIKPTSSVRLDAVPKHEEEGAPAAYYFPPSIDGARPGIFYVNLHDMQEHPKFRMPTLAIHEAEPGHHFQCSLQAEMNIPMIRKLGSYTAYVEGWALYAERLGFEQGFYRTVFEKIGHLQDELFRAVRLVVDTGIHYKRWSREEAIDYMMKKTGFSKEGISVEVERYFVMPGQACSYKIGQLKLLELRNRAKERQGDTFDLREFHNVILKLAAVPLDVLEEEVDKAFPFFQTP